MSVWLWVMLAIIGFFAVSLLVGLVVAAILANLGREFSALIIEPQPMTRLPDESELLEILDDRPVSAGSSSSRVG